MKFKNFLIKNSILFSLFILSNNNIFTQSILNPSPLKKILKEHDNFFNKQYKTTPFQITHNQYFFNNTNLSNFENQNGLYIPKGYGFITGLLYEFSNDYLYLSFEPRLSHYKIVKNDLPEKYGIFSVLNDTPKNHYLKETYQLNNTGVQIKLKNLIFSYGNWNLWWGPGIHNSLSLSNNSKGFYNYSLYLEESINVLKNTKFNFKYLLSSPFTNSNGQKYFLTSLKMKIINRNIEFGYSKDVLSGGYDQIEWSTEEAASVIFLNENMKYWDYLNSFYINYFSKTNGLNLFFEIGSPNRSFGNKEPRNYFGHNIGSNFGMRKYGIFNHENLMLGFEYTRLVQSSYYNILPSPNWYDNQKYNYSSFQGMRWASHSGSDSDDLLFIIGFINNKWSFICGFNYERHGVTFHFPPEVKFENSFTVSYRFRDIFISINYENEFYEHYAFVDNNINVWEQSYEDGSLQRTKSLLFKIEHALF